MAGHRRWEIDVFGCRFLCHSLALFQSTGIPGDIEEDEKYPFDSVTAQMSFAFYRNCSKLNCSQSLEAEKEKVKHQMRNGERSAIA